MERFALRPVTDADYDFLFALHVVTIRESVEPIWGWDEAFQADYFRDHWKTENRTVIVVDGIDAGIFALTLHPDHYFLDLIEIHPDFQGQGIGTALVEEAMGQAAIVGVPLRLHVLKTNPRARTLYIRLGFKDTEEREERFVMEWEATQ
jgi:ribosomal protein S18 acetylase RimI-like enzyme